MQASTQPGQNISMVTIMVTGAMYLTLLFSSLLDVQIMAQMHLLKHAHCKVLQQSTLLELEPMTTMN